MPTARLILCEKTSRWAVALRRALGSRQHVLTQTRSLAQCGRELASSPASLVAVECIADNLDQVLAAIGDWSRRYPHARLAAVAPAKRRPTRRVLTGDCARHAGPAVRDRGLGSLRVRQRVARGDQRRV